MSELFYLRKNIFIEITLLIAAALSLFLCKINLYYLFFSVMVHELGHIIFALIKGAKTENFRIHGFGIEICFPGKHPAPKNLLFISLGGPFASLAMTSFAYSINNGILLLINLSILISNLLPVYPLDGGNILSAILSNHLTRKKIRKIMKFNGVFLGIIITLFGVFVLFISNYNISLIYIGLFISHQEEAQTL